MKKELVRMIGSFNCHSNGHRRVVSPTSSSSTAKPFREAGAPSRSRHRLSSARQVIKIQKFIVILEMPEQTFSSQAIFERAKKLRYLSTVFNTLAQPFPAVGVYSNVFFSLSGVGVRNKLNPDTLKWCSSVFNK